MQSPPVGIKTPDSEHAPSTSGENGYRSRQDSESTACDREHNEDNASLGSDPKHSRDESGTVSPLSTKRKREGDEMEALHRKKLRNDNAQSPGWDSDCPSATSGQRADTQEDEKRSQNDIGTESNATRSPNTEPDICGRRGCHAGNEANSTNIHDPGFFAERKGRKEKGSKESAPMSLTAQIAQISTLMSTFANSTTSPSPSNSGSEPPSRNNSRPGSRRNSQASFFPPTPTRCIPLQPPTTGLPFSATYRSPFDQPTAFDFPFVNPALVPASVIDAIPQRINSIPCPPTQLHQGMQPPQIKFLQAQNVPQYQHAAYPINQMPPPHPPSLRPSAPYFNSSMSQAMLPSFSPGSNFLPHPSFFATSTHYLTPREINGKMGPPPPIAQPMLQGHRPSIPFFSNVPPPVVHLGKPPPTDPSSRHPSHSIEKSADVLLELFSSARWLATFNRRHRFVEECRRCNHDRMEWAAKKSAYDSEISRLQSRVRELEHAAGSASETPTSLPMKRLTPPPVEPNQGAEAAGPDSDDGEVSKVHALETELAGLRDRVAHQTTHITRLKAAAIERAALGETVKQLGEEKAELAERYKHVSKEKNELARKIVAHEEAVARTQPMVAMLRGRMESAAKQIAERDKRIGELEKKVERAVRGGRQDVEALEEAARQRDVYIGALEDTCERVTQALMGLEIEQSA